VVTNDAEEEVIRVANVSSVPSESSTGLDGLLEHLVRSSRINVLWQESVNERMMRITRVNQAYTHVVDHGNGELLVLAGSQSCGESQDIRLGRTISSLELVVVGGAISQAWDLNVVEELVTHCDEAERAWRSTVVAAML